MNPLFHGLLVALATPFTANGDVDLAAFRRLVRHVVRGGADGLVVLGSTGEAATLMDVERDRLIAACLEEAGGKMVVAGAGSNATRQAVEWTRRAEQLGCAGVLVVTPYYNKPVPDGMVAHFHAVADATAKASVIAYNVPGRTGVNLAPPTLLRVMAHEKVLAVKESSGNVQQIGEILRTLPAHRHVLAGDDQLALPSIALGAVGLVSVVGNACPAETKALVDHARAGRLRSPCKGRRYQPWIGMTVFRTEAAGQRLAAEPRPGRTEGRAGENLEVQPVIAHAVPVGLQAVQIGFGAGQFQMPGLHVFAIDADELRKPRPELACPQRQGQLRHRPPLGSHAAIVDTAGSRPAPASLQQHHTQAQASQEECGRAAHNASPHDGHVGAKAFNHPALPQPRGHPKALHSAFGPGAPRRRLVPA